MCQPFGNHLGWSEHGRSGYPQFPIDFQMLCRPGIRKSEVYEELYGREVVFIRWLWQGSGLGWHDEFMSFFGQFLGFISQKWTIIFIPCHGWSIFPIYFRNKPMTIFWVRPEMGDQKKRAFGQPDQIRHKFGWCTPSQMASWQIPSFFLGS